MDGVKQATVENMGCLEFDLLCLKCMLGNQWEGLEGPEVIVSMSVGCVPIVHADGSSL